MVRRRSVRKQAVARKGKRSPSRARKPDHFVGRDASPVLDRYPPRTGTPPVPTSVRGDQLPPVAPTSAPPPVREGPEASPTAALPVATTASPLITLDRPFDVDAFAAGLGETSIRVTVPRDALPELLRRVMEFMSFGIYVYSISVRPAPSELLKEFVVELRRVDFSAEKRAWVPFVEKGAVPPSGTDSHPTA